MSDKMSARIPDALFRQNANRNFGDKTCFIIEGKMRLAFFLILCTLFKQSNVHVKTGTKCLQDGLSPPIKDPGCFQCLRKTTLSLRQYRRSLGTDLNPRPPEYEREAIITRPERSGVIFNKF